MFQKPYDKVIKSKKIELSTIKIENVDEYVNDVFQYHFFQDTNDLDPSWASLVRNILEDMNVSNVDEKIEKMKSSLNKKYVEACVKTIFYLKNQASNNEKQRRKFGEEIEELIENLDKKSEEKKSNVNNINEEDLEFPPILQEDDNADVFALFNVDDPKNEEGRIESEQNYESYELGPLFGESLEEFLNFEKNS